MTRCAQCRRMSKCAQKTVCTKKTRLRTDDTRMVYTVTRLRTDGFVRTTKYGRHANGLHGDATVQRHRQELVHSLGRHTACLNFDATVQRHRQEFIRKSLSGIVPSAWKTGNNMICLHFCSAASWRAKDCIFHLSRRENSEPMIRGNAYLPFHHPTIATATIFWFM